MFWKTFWQVMKSPVVRETIAIIVITIGEELIRGRRKRPPNTDDDSEFRGW
jgi:hypothetical protein